MNRLLSSRALLLLGLAIGLISFSGTIGHIGDPNYLLAAGMHEGEPIITTHAWYHALREAAGDVATMAILLLVFFGSVRFRTPETWLISLLLMVGYYAPFWIGAPFSEGLASPNWRAEVVHIVMATLSVTALFVGRPAFHDSALTDFKTYDGSGDGYLDHAELKSWLRGNPNNK